MSCNPETTQIKFLTNLKEALILDDSKHLRELLVVIDLKTLEDPQELLFSAIDYKLSKMTLTVLVEAFNKANVSLNSVRNHIQHIQIKENNRTALDNACIDEYWDGIEVLIKGGADYQRRMPNSEKTYLDFYKEKNPDRSSEIDSFIHHRKEKEKSSSDGMSGSELILFLKKNFVTLPSKTNQYQKLSSVHDEKVNNTRLLSSARSLPSSTKSKVD